MSGVMSDDDSMLLSRPPVVQPKRLTNAFLTMVSLILVGLCVVSVWVTPSEVKRHVVDMQLEKKFTIKNSHIDQAADGDINNNQGSSHMKEVAQGDINNYKTINEYPDSKVINIMKQNYLVVTMNKAYSTENTYAGQMYTTEYNCTLTAPHRILWTKLGYHVVRPDTPEGMGPVGVPVYTYYVEKSVVQAFSKNIDLKRFSVLNVTLGVYDSKPLGVYDSPYSPDDYKATPDFLFVAGIPTKEVAEASNISTSPDCPQQSTLCMWLDKFKAKHVAVKISAMPKRCSTNPNLLCTVVSVPLKDLQGFSVFRIWVNGTYGLLKGTMGKGGFCPGCVEKHYYNYVSSRLG